MRLLNGATANEVPMIIRKSHLGKSYLSNERFRQIKLISNLHLHFQHIQQIVEVDFHRKRQCLN
jgi:hypothetical protein